jgi:hypothetical protein
MLMGNYLSYKYFMKNKEEVIIVIPVYKSMISANEKRSLSQCFTVLSQFPICFVCGQSLNLDDYISVLPGDAAYTTERFKDDYFASISTYNRLCLSLNFYKRFKNYNYIFLYQLDAWVFKNELLHWCSLGYDFIGAPWFEGWGNATQDSAYLGVGNGGFCLRKVDSFIKVLKSFAYIISVMGVLRNFKHNPSVKKLFWVFKNLTVANNTFYLFNNYDFQEDYFWGKIAHQKFSWFRVADKTTASQFSLEGNAPLLYKINNNHLPFGCHAWEKYHKEFWLQFIDAE